MDLWIVLVGILSMGLIVQTQPIVYCQSPSPNYCDCFDAVCSQCRSYFGGCCYRYLENGTWRCDSKEPSGKSYIECNLDCIAGIDSPCKVCKQEDVNYTVCVECAFGYVEVEGSANYCCFNRGLLFTSISSSIIALGVVLTTVLLIWYIKHRHNNNNIYNTIDTSQSE